MSHPDPCYDPDNSEDDDMNYDDYNDFHDGVDGSNDEWKFGDESDALLAEYFLDRYDTENSGEIDWHDENDDSMDGDHDSAMSSAGWGMDEDYDYYREDFHSDDGLGYYED